MSATSARCRVMQLGSPTGLYGAERWILALVRHLDASRVESIVGVIRDDPALTAPLCQEAGKLGLRNRVFDAFGRINWSAVSQLREYLVGNDIHILHTHGYKTDIIGLLAVRGTRCRLVTTPHGWSVNAGLMLRIYEGVDRAIFPFFDAVAPLSERILTELQGMPGLRRKLRLIRNGVDLSEVEAPTPLTPQLAAWKAEGHLVFGYIGQLISRKGLDVLLQAFARLPLEKKRLALVGEGPQRQELEALATSLGLASQVRFFGFREDRIGFLKAFDVFVLPSRLEGIPRCLMESMGAGVPIIASDIPGCVDLVRHDDTGLLFPVDDVGALTDALTVVQDAALRSRLAARAREFVYANFSAASMAQQYQSLYGTLLRSAA